LGKPPTIETKERALDDQGGLERVQLERGQGRTTRNVMISAY
jgi:hypothetical protein